MAKQFHSHHTEEEQNAKEMLNLAPDPHISLSNYERSGPPEEPQKYFSVFLTSFGNNYTSYGYKLN